MLHPSYTEIMAFVNSDVEEGEQPLVQSRYSIVMATAKRARQIINRNAAKEQAKKPLSTAVSELYSGRVKILSEQEAVVMAENLAAAIAAKKAEKERIAAEKAAAAAQKETEGQTLVQDEALDSLDMETEDFLEDEEYQEYQED